MVKICNKCGKENPENLTFCEDCGAILVGIPDSNRKTFILKEDFEKIFREYLPQREKYRTVSAPIAYFIRNELKDDFIDLIDGEFPYCEIYPTAGTRNLAHCPQLSFKSDLGCDLRLHFVFIFKADMSGVYLSMRNLDRLDPDEILKTKRDVYQYCIKKHLPDFEFLESIDLKSDTPFSVSYKKSTIISRFYDKDNIPSDDVLIEEIKEFIKCGKLLCELKPLNDEDLVKKVMKSLNKSLYKKI